MACGVKSLRLVTDCRVKYLFLRSLNAPQAKPTRFAAEVTAQSFRSKSGNFAKFTAIRRASSRGRLTWIKAPNVIPVFELGHRVDRIYYDSLDN